MTRMRAGWQLLLGLVGKFLLGVSWFITHVFGIFEWQPPAWVSWFVRQIAQPCRQIARFLTADRKTHRRAGPDFLAGP